MRVLSLLCLSLPLAAALGSRQAKRSLTAARLGKRDDESDSGNPYPAYHLSVPVDHFHNSSVYEPHSNDMFNLRYWFDASHYEPGGPVIVIQTGEGNGVYTYPVIQKGIVAKLAQATHGIGLVLEHRYYGQSWPTPDLSIENLRFLTTEQALADQAYFAQHVVFPGLEHVDLTSASTAWIAYGGSYAGALTAFLRVVYPDVFWGAISSSGVVKAIWDFYDYYNTIAENAPAECVSSQRTLVHIVDTILLKNDTELTHKLQTAFGLQNITYYKDFASAVSINLAGWQDLIWDPNLSYDEVYVYCANISSTALIYPDTESLRPVVTSLIKETKYTPDENLVNKMLNFIGYVHVNSVVPCKAQSDNQDDCFGSFDLVYYHMDSLESRWRSWTWQYCTEWGFLQTGYAPHGQLPVISSLLDTAYESIVCDQAFGRTTPANVDLVNKYGGYDISYPRLAFVEGSADPWRPATTHAFEQGAKQRKSSVSEPFILIPGAVHHWDLYGLFPNETTPSLPPATVADAQSQEVQFVQEWMREWKSAHGKPTK